MNYHRNLEAFEAVGSIIIANVLFWFCFAKLTGVKTLLSSDWLGKVLTSASRIGRRNSDFFTESL